jgi:hypothetical protein
MNYFPKSPLSYSLKLLRHAFKRMGLRIQYPGVDFSKVPILFANSFPKSGTHLLTQIMEGFCSLGPATVSGLPAIVMFDGPTGREFSNFQIQRQLDYLKAGDICYGHLHALPPIVDRLDGPDYATIFILRDPRDVVISHVHYVTDMEPDHVHHSYYKNTLTTFEDRLQTSILGLPHAANPFPDIRQRFEPYVGWLTSKDVLSIRYEHLVEDREEWLREIVRFVASRGFPIHATEEDSVQKLIARIDPLKSPTFRRGKTGGWKGAFSPEIKKLFKDVTGDLLIQLGYEKNANW